MTRPVRRISGLLSTRLNGKVSMKSYLIKNSPRQLLATGSNGKPRRPSPCRRFDEIQRYCSSLPPHQSSNIESVWKQTTKRLLEETLVGSFSSQTWNEAHLAILWWLDQSDERMDSVSQCLKLLDRMWGEEQSSENQNVQTRNNMPTSYHTDLLNLVVNRWRQAIAGETASFNLRYPNLTPSAILEQVHRYHQNSSHLNPDIQTYSMIIDAAAKIAHSEAEGAVLAESILDWTIQQSEDFPHLRPTTITFASVIKAWANNSGADEAPKRADDLLQRMMQLHVENSEWDVAPNQVAYSTVIDTMAKNGRVDRVEELMSDMYAEYNNGNEGLKPSIHIFNGYLAALAKSGLPDRAEAVLRKMEELYEAGELDTHPDVISYTTVLDSLAKSKEVGTPERAEAILRQMSFRGVEPNAISYNTVINSYAKAGQAEKAETLFREMSQAYTNGHRGLRPTSQSYSALLVSLSQSRSREAGERGERILRLMETLAKSGDLESTPHLISYNCVLDCWAKTNRPGAAKRALEFLHKMAQNGVHPDVYSYNIVLHALAQQGQPQEAHQLMNRMLGLGVIPDVTTYNTLLSAWSKSKLPEAPQRAIKLFAQMKQQPSVMLDLVTFNTVLNCYGKTGNPERAEQLLGDLCRGIYPSVHPDRTSFNTVIAAWSRSRHPDAGQRAEQVLNKMQELGGAVRPDTISYNSVLHAWSKSCSSGVAERCAGIIQMMRDLYEAGDLSVKPDVITYNMWMTAWGSSSRVDAPECADAILHDMERLYNLGDKSIRPNGRCYRTLINVWSKSGRSDAASHADAYLRRMIQLWELTGQQDARPTVHDFTAIFQSWMKNDDPTALSKIEALVDLLQAQVQQGNSQAIPEPRVFAGILMVLASSNLDDKTDRAHKLIDAMREFGVKPDGSTKRWLQRQSGL
jgi:pentatricopeptide repeat protein